MGKRNLVNIFITGFSYTGKTQVSQVVARLLGWKLVDTDDEIVKLAGKPIPDIFTQDGEDHFRELEHQALINCCRGSETVISTGGGIIISEKNRATMKESGVIVCLEAEPETIFLRLIIDSQKSGDKVIRPLLAGDDPKERITSLKASRQIYYCQSDWTVHTDFLTIEEVAEKVIKGWEYIHGKEPESKVDDELACVVTTPTESYPVFVGWGLLDQLGTKMSNAGLSGNVHLISDDKIFPIYGERAKISLQNAGFSVDSFIIPQGEKSKSLEITNGIYDFLVRHHVERSDVIVALGGGVVEDVAGFVAATILRGIHLVQAPTSLVAMVDASIGGKVAVNHPEGKNLVGAFYQPRLVLADVNTLTTLPERELTSGWAEVIKHGLICDVDYFQFLENNVAQLKRLDKAVTNEAIRRSAAIKAYVVSADEKESGLRTILNYGHTMAHGFETVTGYDKLLHGEAVAIGMTGAATIAEKLGLLHSNSVRRQKALVSAFGLPTFLPGIDLASVIEAMSTDKKVRDKSIRWVLLEEIGTATVRHDIPGEMVEAALREVLKT